MVGNGKVALSGLVQNTNGGGAGRPPDVINHTRVPTGDMLHPTQKNVGLMTTVLEFSAGDLVWEPYAGSGTTLVAAKMLGKRAIGCEISEQYCSVAAERLRQGSLF